MASWQDRALFIWLDETGRVKQYLTRGNYPSVGETDFNIFAYFDGVDTNNFDSATIKFRKPDKNGTTYPLLVMTVESVQYQSNPNDGSNVMFQNNETYKGFRFDFSNFTESQEAITLLDTPGLWEATITLLGQGKKTNVSGLITFSVGRSASDYIDETQLGLDEVIQNIVQSIQSVKTTDDIYMRVYDNFILDATQKKLPTDQAQKYSVVFDKTTKDFYRITNVIPGDNEHTVGADYEKILDAVKTIDASDVTKLKQIMDYDPTGAVFVYYNEEAYIAAVRSIPDSSNVSFEIKGLTEDKRYHSDSVPQSMPFASAITDTYYIPGAYYTPHIDENGILTWTNTGNLPNPDPIQVTAGFGTPHVNVHNDGVGIPSATISASGPYTAKVFDFDFHHLKGETGAPAGFGTIDAVVDSNVGTPEVDVVTSGADTAKNIYFTFKNLKGSTGQAAGFGTPTASVDDETGAPSVDITTSGPNTAKVFNFAFHNLKGDKGEKGDTGAQGQQGGQGEQGEKGDTGETGNGIERMTADQSGELYVEYTDGTTQDVGMIGQGVVVVDSQFDENSTNPLQNKVITERWKEIDSASVDVIDYSMAKVSGKDDGLALPEESQLELKALRGNTVAWNQLVDKWKIVDVSGSSRNNNVPITLSSSGVIDEPTISATLGHKAITIFDYYCSSDFDGSVVYRNYITNTLNVSITDISTSLKRFAIISEIKVARDTINLNVTITAGSVTFNNLHFIDLTQLYGAGNEPTAVTDEKAQWAINYALKHPAYDAGSLVSVDLSAYETEGFNQWDEEWEIGGLDTSNGTDDNSLNTRIRSKNYVRVKPDTTYYFKSPNNVRPCYYDINYNFVSAGGWDTGLRIIPANVCYLRFMVDPAYGTTYNHNICINISDTSLNGTYKPYEKNSYPISFHGKSAGSVYDERKGAKDIVRIGDVDLGTLDWYPINQTSSDGWLYATQGIRNTIKKGDGEILCSRLENNSHMGPTSTGQYGIMNHWTGVIYAGFYGFTRTGEEFKAAVSGFTLNYELATPVQSVNDPLPNAIKVYQDGTEWQINDGAPCGMEKNYDISIKDQVLTNVRVDARQEEEIDGLKEVALTSEESNFVSDEYEKGLNLLSGVLKVLAGTVHGLYFYCEKTGEYTFSINQSVPYIAIDNYPPTSQSVIVSNTDRVTATLTAGKAYLFTINTTSVGWDAAAQFVSSAMLNYGSTALPYKPYNANKHISNAQAEFLRDEYGKTLNLWDEQWELGYYNANGEPVTNPHNIRSKNYIEVTPRSTLFFLCDSDAEGRFYDASKNYVSSVSLTENSSFVVPNNAYYLRFHLMSSYGTTYRHNVTISKGDYNSVGYQPYNGKVLHAIDVEGVLLWENGDPTSTFGEQTITTSDMSSYKKLRLELKYVHGSDATFFVDVGKVLNSTIRLTCTQYDYAGGAYNVYLRARDALILSNTSVYFKKSVIQGGDSDSWLVPIAIYGIK